jgi:RNA polymerase sigma-70 factor (ECF subfamily)
MVPATGPEEVAAEWSAFERARRGDEEAWRGLTARHQARLTALALFVTRSPAVAEDVVQETFLRALRARLWHRRGKVGSYLATIAYRIAVKEARRGCRYLELDALEPRRDDRPGPLEVMLTEERDRQIAAAIGRLSDEQRHVLALRFYGGHSYEEISLLLRVPLGTVKSRIFHGVRHCRGMLSEKGLLE